MENESLEQSCEKHSHPWLCRERGLVPKGTETHGRSLGRRTETATAEREQHHAWAPAWVSHKEHGSRGKETGALQLEPFGEAAGVGPACCGLRSDGDGRNWNLWHTCLSEREKVSPYRNFFENKI